jgi:Protein of unknown function (DUF2934)
MHTPFDREKRIAEAAYFRAEKRGFAPGYALEDWLEAEALVNFELAAEDRTIAAHLVDPSRTLTLGAADD